MYAERIRGKGRKQRRFKWGTARKEKRREEGIGDEDNAQLPG